MSRKQRDERKRSGAWYRGYDASKPKRTTYDHLQAAAIRCAQSLVLGIEVLTPSARLVTAKLVTPRSAWRIGFVLASWYVLNVAGAPISDSARRFLNCPALTKLHSDLDLPIRQCLQNWIKPSYEAADIQDLSAAKRTFAHCIDMGGLSVLASVLFADEYPHIAEWMAQNDYSHNLDRLWESVLARTAEAA
jgi:hypothetical protein